MSDSGYDFLFKAIVCGDGGVGKTALTIRFTKGFFEKEYKLTIGVDFHIKTIEVETDEGIRKCKLQLWDTGGQERFSSVRPMYYRGALGALLVFDLTNSESFEHLPNWIEEIKSNTKPDIPMLLIANKSDLIDERLVNPDDIQEFATKFNLYYLETSAKSGEGVGDCFAVLAYLMMDMEVPKELLGQKELVTPEMFAAKTNQTLAAKPTLEAPPVPEPELVFEAPTVPEPVPEPAFEAPPVPEPEPEPAFEAPPVPEPEPEPAFEAPPVPEPKPVSETPLLPSEEPKSTIESSHVKEAFPTLSNSDDFAPKSVPFSSKSPITAVPAPPGFKPISTAPTTPAPKKEESIPFALEKSLTPKPKPPIQEAFEPQPITPTPQPPESEKTSIPEKPILFSESKPSEAELPSATKQPTLFSELKPTEAPTLTKYLPETTPPSDSFVQSLSNASKKKEKDEAPPEPASSFIPFMSQKKESAAVEKNVPLMIIPNAEEIKKKQKEKKKGKEKEKEKVKAPPKEKAKDKKKDVVICRQCGAILSKEYLFCNRCGAKLM